jgi:Protein of unknown function (DUF1822)
MNLTQSEPIIILLDSNAHRYAAQFAGEQATSQKGKQVYLNTLAVYGVSQYLKCLSIPTNLSQSNCWHPSLRAIFNIADLVLPNLGRLECCPILPGEQMLNIPLEVSDNCLGYIAVQFTDTLERVQLLGFLPSDRINQQPEPIPLTQLQSLNKLLETIQNRSSRVDLHQWIEGIFQPEWQALESLLATQKPVFRTSIRSSAQTISRGKVITLDEYSLLLIMKIGDRSTEEVNIALQIYPFDKTDYLPIGLHVTVLDDLEQVCLEAQTNNQDNWIQLEFATHPEEEFSVKIELEEANIVEEFII